MLLEFRVENFRSFRDPQEFSTDRWNPVSPPEGWAYPDISSVAAIYGPNASGKSAFVRALAFLVGCVRDSVVRWDIDEGVPRTPFLLDQESRARPSRFEIVFRADDGIRYQYLIVVDDREVLEETLWAYYTTQRRRIFMRTGGSVTWHKDVTGSKRAIDEMVKSRPNAMLLSIAAQLGNAVLEPPFLWLARKVSTTNARYSRTEVFHRRVAELMSEDSGFASRFRAMIRSTDLGITDVEVVEDQSSSKTLQMVHKAGDALLPLPLREESDGTRSMIRIGFLALRVLEGGGVWVIDEIDASLHPTLVGELIDLFQDPASNPLQAQLIITTHDVSLLSRTGRGAGSGLPTIERDQFWVLEKDHTGASQLVAVRDFHPRKDENLERRYMTGRFGGVPQPTLRESLSACDGDDTEA